MSHRSGCGAYYLLCAVGHDAPALGNFGGHETEFLKSHHDVDADADTLDTAVTMDRSARFRDTVSLHGTGDSRPDRRGNSRLRPHDKDGSQNGHGMLRVHAMNVRRL
jgi:hypothetical protein